MTRSLAAEATRERILDAATAAFTNHWYDDVTLRGIAREAGCALQTVLNHFRTKDDLLSAVADRHGKSIEAVRWQASANDPHAAIALLVDDYERTGDFTLRMLSLEGRVPAVDTPLGIGRKGHESWVELVFIEALQGLDRAERKRRLAQLVVITDIYTWKLLRRDKRLGRDQTITAMRELVDALRNDT